MQQRILVIEDNDDLSKLILLHLTDQSWETDLAEDGNEGYKKATTQKYDLILLDIMLPGMDGIEILKQLRSQNILTPVLMLTSKSSEIDRILGLEFGADDYVTKPFSIQELIARIKAIFRRIENLKFVLREETQGPLSFGDLSIDPIKRKVLIKNRSIDLTAKEYDLLYYFARHPGRVFNRSQLLDKVWGYGHDGYEHTVNSNINRLRSKIEINPAQPDYVLTVWGVGYKFRDT
ncbi:MAG: response regulator transcription factor [Proteobacteria bacterium]|nr:response regulator transcription factor [Desulfobacula sp.]MBU3952257.1 response regulator transcription factor [Pseudomonadota bacterium]MBU4129648.1 response regulator transcription factor [Pseudomonadota bacterium]